MQVIGRACAIVVLALLTLITAGCGDQSPPMPATRSTAAASHSAAQSPTAPTVPVKAIPMPHYSPVETTGRTVSDMPTMSGGYIRTVDIAVKKTGSKYEWFVNQNAQVVPTPHDPAKVPTTPAAVLILRDGQGYSVDAGAACALMSHKNFNELKSGTQGWVSAKLQDPAKDTCSTPA